MKTYPDLLREYIENSELSLSQIETKLREKGLSTNKAYISKLQNGKLPPAGDDINKALAEVLNGDEDELILLSYAEKAPILNDLVNDLINSFQSMLLNNKEILVSIAGPLYSIEDQLNENFENIINDLMSNMSLKEKVELIKYLIRSLGDQQFKNFGEFSNGTLKIDPLNFLTDEDEKNKFKGIFNTERSNETLSDLSSDEHLFLSEQLEVYRKLKMNINL